MANSDNTNQGNQGMYGNAGQYGAGGQFGNQGQYGYTGFPGRANQGQMGTQGQYGMGNPYVNTGRMSGQGTGQYGGQGQMGQMGQMGRANAANIGPHTGHGPQNYQRSDQRIKEDVSDQLTAHPHLDARGITVEVNSGEVTLTGTVDSRQAKRTADDIADGVPGVKDVHNQLKVQQQQGQQAAH